MPEIVVAIPTYRRPQGLERLLGALSLLDTERHVCVLVADNDSARHEGADLCTRIASKSFRWPLEAIVVAERGIAQARNALAERALADPSMRFIAMLDDDEWPQPQWLEALMRVQSTTGADVVRGSVLRDFEIAPPPWARDWEGVADIDHPAGYEGVVEGIGNALVVRHCFEALPRPYFDPQFGLTGGEDKDFLVRLRAAGMRFSRAPEAIAYEHVPASRVKLKWSLLRAYRTGNCDMRIALKYRAGVYSEFSKIFAALIAFPVLSLVFSLNPRHRLDGVRKLYRAAGKIGALFGHRYHEYASRSGR